MYVCIFHSLGILPNKRKLACKLKLCDYNELLKQSRKKKEVCYYERTCPMRENI